jgi:cystathionine beta-lyase
MKYDFDKPCERRNTYSAKWDVGENELPMWIADMDFETVPEAKAAVVTVAQRGVYGYSTLPDEYFESVSDFYFKRHGYRFAPSDMIYSSGIVAAISSLVRRFTLPSEKVLLQTPVYNNFYNCVENNGRRVIESKLLCEDGVYSIDFDDLEAKLSDPQTSLMILCNPHNPIGKIWDRETLARIGELCKKHSVTVISDEIHSEFTRPGASYVPFASASEVCADISLTCISSSKTFNMAGLQAACIVAKNKTLRHRAWRGFNNDEIGEPNVFAVSANIAAYRHGSEWVDELLEYVFENRDIAYEYINSRIEGLRAIDSDATYLLWVDVSYYNKDSKAFAEDLRAKTGLYISDGTKYGSGGESYIRINLATQRVNVLDALSRLSRYVDMIKNKS